MTVPDIDSILHECFLAVGQAVGTERVFDFEAVVWWRTRYRRAFLEAIGRGNSWTRDRQRVTAVGRFLGQRAVHHAGGGPINVRAAALASLDVEAACRMNAVREGLRPEPCTSGACLAF